MPILSWPTEVHHTLPPQRLPQFHLRQVPLRPQVPLRYPKGMISVPHRISVPHQVTVPHRTSVPHQATVPHRISVPHQDPVHCWTWMTHQVQCAISHREATIRCQSLVGLRRFITLCLLNVFHNSISANVSLAVETYPAASTRTFHSEPPLTSESHMNKIPAGVYEGSLFAVPDFLKEGTTKEEKQQCHTQRMTGQIQKQMSAPPLPCQTQFNDRVSCKLCAPNPCCSARGNSFCCG